MMKYGRTPRKQTEGPIPGREARMKKTESGGWNFVADDWDRLNRFLILGTEKNTYYITEAKLTADNISALGRCVEADGHRVVNAIVEVSKSGAALKQDPAIYALAYTAAQSRDVSVRRAAYAAVADVCRTGTHLFAFAEASKRCGAGWGKLKSRAFKNWYSQRADRLAYQLLKYRSRRVDEGGAPWTHRDLLRLAHVRPQTEDHNHLFRWAVGKGFEDGAHVKLLEQIYAYEEAKSGVDKARMLRLITDYRMTREMIPTQWLKDPDVQHALLRHMPLGAMVRNLANFTESGLLSPMSDAERFVIKKLGESEYLRRARIHPAALYIARKVYEGRCRNARISRALEQAFYGLFDYVEGSGKPILLAVDNSGSMWTRVWSGRGNLNILASEIAAVMALATAHVEADHHIVGYTDRITDLDIRKGQRVEDIVRHIGERQVGQLTDCGLPYKYARENGMKLGAVVQYTDNQSWRRGHPQLELEKLRQTSGQPVRTVAAAFASSDCTILDPNDNGCLNIAGLDARVPQLVANFVK